ncbi:MAG: DUF4426 domain-containing protein [Pseudomonadota bacterium]|nr:DUF4426 domain-containing protein [Pseudomonadota bacterium]
MKTLPLALFLVLSLTACGQDAPRPATPVGQNAPSQAARATLGDMQLEARLVRSSDLSEAIARQYGVRRDADNWLLLVSPRSAAGDAIPVDGLHLQAHAAALAETMKPLALRRIDSAGFSDWIAEIHASAPTTLQLEIDARRDTASAQLRFSRDLPRP